MTREYTKTVFYFITKVSTRLEETVPNTTYAQATLNLKYSEAYTSTRDRWKSNTTFI